MLYPATWDQSCYSCFADATNPSNCYDHLIYYCGNGYAPGVLVPMCCSYNYPLPASHSAVGYRTKCVPWQGWLNSTLWVDGFECDQYVDTPSASSPQGSSLQGGAFVGVIVGITLFAAICFPLVGWCVCCYSYGRCKLDPNRLSSTVASLLPVFMLTHHPSLSPPSPSTPTSPSYSRSTSPLPLPLSRPPLPPRPPVHADVY